MARLSRITQLIFGTTGNVGTGGFGAAAAGNTATNIATSSTLTTLQGLSAWASGWLSATLGTSKFPAIEDMNAVNYVLTTQLSYLFQQGVPEYDSGTTYYTNSIVCKAGTYQLYGSVTNGNVGNALTNPTYWTLLIDLSLPTSSVQGQCYLSYTSTTVVTLLPYKGNKVTFPSGLVANIGTGITSTITNASLNGVAAQTLSVNTLYYAYLWNNGTNYVIDWSTTGHSTDSSTGIEIKTGDAARVLVGMAYPQTGPVFADTGANRLVISWFNRKTKFSTGSFSTTRTTTSTTIVEINTEIRNQFLNWGDQAVFTSFSGNAQNSGSSNGTTSYIILDSTSTIVVFNDAYASTVTLGANLGTSCSGPTSTSEGFHFVSLGGSVSAGTGTWQSAQSNILNVTIEG